MKPDSMKLNNIQALRAIAALMVVFAHIDLPRYQSVGIHPDMFAFGAFGVDVFFVISGFIMMYIGAGKSGLRDAGGFLERRFLRVWPLYAFFTAVAVWLAYESDPNWWLSYYYPRAKMDPAWIAGSLTFTRWSRSPVDAIGWTLIYEFWFYVSVSIMIALRAGPKYFFLGYTVLILAVRALGLAKSPMLNQFTHPFMLEFVYGVVVYELFAGGRLGYSNGKALALAAAAAVTTVLAWRTLDSPALYSRVLFSGSAGFFIVALALTLEHRFTAGKALVLLGDASYSIYLAHWTVLTTLPSLLDLHHLSNMGPITYIAVNVAVALLLSFAVFFLIEKPLRRAAQCIHRRFRRAKGAPAPATP